MNDAYIAMQWRDELADTMFFGGFDTVYSKTMLKGKKVYNFKSSKINLTITGKTIIIDDVKFKSVRDAKRHICERYVR
jgi:hypothetical protein